MSRFYSYRFTDGYWWAGVFTYVITSSFLIALAIYEGILTVRKLIRQKNSQMAPKLIWIGTTLGIFVSASMPINSLTLRVQGGVSRQTCRFYLFQGAVFYFISKQIMCMYMSFYTKTKNTI